MGVAAILVSILCMARAEGGWSAFVTPFMTHGQRHFSRLVGNLGGYSELGLVKGLGGTCAGNPSLSRGHCRSGGLGEEIRPAFRTGLGHSFSR